MNSLTRFAAIVGIDWADKKHDLCLKPAGAERLEFSTLPHTPEAIDEWVNRLRQRFGDGAVAVCLESRKAPLIHVLLKYDTLVLFPVNPQTLARYRRALRPSRAKDDPSDAQLLIELVGRHPEQFPSWQPDSAALRCLTQLVEMRRRLVADKVRLTNRLTAALKLYFPQVLDWFKDKDTLIFCHFLQRWPDLPAAQRAPKHTLLRFFESHNAHYADINAQRVVAIQAAMPLTHDVGVVEPNRLLTQMLIRQLLLVLDSIRRFDQEIAQRFSTMPDAELFATLPGAGVQFAPRLLTAFGEDRQRFPKADALAQYAGIAPVTERSGNKHWVHWRYSCPKFLRQSFVEWARESTRHSFWARAFYQHQRELGKTHQMAVRALAFKWIRILWRCWQDRKPYNETTYLMSLQDKGSPLLQYIAN
jgi:transposase